jgi:hypothetical protein
VAKALTLAKDRTKLTLSATSLSIVSGKNWCSSTMSASPLHSRSAVSSTLSVKAAPDVSFGVVPPLDQILGSRR